MTRLIDADAIKNLELITERGTADCGEEFVYMSAINEMPTVEAIPIEWVCDYIRERKDIPLKHRECVSEMFDAWVSYMAEKEEQEEWD